MLKDLAKHAEGRNIILRGDQCLCGICKGKLGSPASHWKVDTTTVTVPLAKVFKEADTEVRERIDEPVTLSYRYCPHCGCCLSTNIGVAGRKRAPAG